MRTEARPKGTWMNRFAIRFFTVVLAVLVYWTLGFLVGDIRTVSGPDYLAVEKRHVDQGLLERQAALDRQLADLTREHAGQQARQAVLGDGSRSLEQTITQLVEVQKLRAEKSIALTPAEQENFSSSLNLFLENQRKYQAMSQGLAELLERKQSLEREREEVAQRLEEQRRPARQEHQQLMGRHRMRLAWLQLAVLLPILALAAFLLLKRRGSLYFPLVLASGAATLFKVGVVVHEYFPTRVFKYLLIGGLLAAVTRLLVHFIRAVAYPQAQWVVRQYREAYERFLCPVCDYPIRVGPRRYLFWTRRTVNKTVVPVGAERPEETYTCPSCGHALFETCAACGRVRHALLPHCAHCGAEKAVP